MSGDNAHASTSADPCQSVTSTKALPLGSFSYQCLGESKSNEIDDISIHSSESILEEWKGLFRRSSVISTETLIEAVNGWPDKSLRDALIKKALQSYVDELGNQETPWTLDPSQGKEIASLSGFQVTTALGKRAVRLWLDDLISKINVKNEDELLMEALSCALLPLDPEIFEGDPTYLTTLVNILLGKLDPKATITSKTLIPRQYSILCALYSTFRLIVLVYPIEFDVSKDAGLIPEFKTKVDDIIEASTDCFPMLHTAKVIQQSMLKLRTKDAKKWALSASKVAWKALRGLAHSWNSFQLTVTTTRFDLESIDKALILFGEVWNLIRTQLQEQWFHRLDELNTMAVYVILDPKNLQRYFNKLIIVMGEESSWRKEKRKHLRYGIIEQLTMLALNECCPQIQKDAKREMENLRYSKDAADVTQDEDISNFLSECLARIEKQNERKEDARLVNGEAQTPTPPRSDSLFHKVKCHVLGTSEDPGICEVPGLQPEMLKLLKMGYRDNLSQMESPIITQRVDVSTLRFNLMRINDIEKVLDSRNCVTLKSCLGRELVSPEFKRSIEMEELFPDEEDIFKVLVMGMPGSGRSALARRLALDWSNGHWGSHFKTVFLLHLSAQLKEDGVIDLARPSLSGAIVRSCFAHRDLGRGFDELQTAVQDELKKSTTLVILDGMEEAKGDGSNNPIDALINQAKGGEHKRLMFLRPCGTKVKEEIRGNDLVIELAGLTDKDLPDHLCGQDSTTKSILDAFPSLQGIARNPVNCHILGSLLSPANVGASSCRRQRSIAWFCRRLVARIWKRCDKKKKDCDETERDCILDDMGRIALSALQEGQCHLKDCDLEDELAHRIDRPIKRGFLVCNCDGQVEFTHSILMQYFAARFLAKCLCLDGSEQSKAEECVQTKKYVKKYADSMSMVAGEIASDKGANGILKMVRCIDEGDVESVGVHHLRLKMNALQQWLLESDTKTGFDEVVKEMNFVQKFVVFLENGIQRVQDAYMRSEPIDDSLLKAVNKLLKDFPSVVARVKSQLLSTVEHQMKEHKWDVDHLTVEAYAMIINCYENDLTKCITFIKNGLNETKPWIRGRVLRLLHLPSCWSIEFCRRMLNILKTPTHVSDIDDYGDAVIDLLRRLPDCSDEDIEFLAKICKNKCPSSKIIAEAIPKILTTEKNVSLFVHLLVGDSADSTQRMSPAIIEVMQSCMKRTGRIDDTVERLRNAWAQMDKEQRKAASQTIIKAIRLEPNKTVEIVGSLLHEETDTTHPDPVSVMQKAARHEDQSIRILAFNAMGIMADHRLEEFPGTLVETVIQGCHQQEALQEACAALKAVKYMVAVGVDTSTLLQTCHELLGNAIDEVRKLAGEVLRSAAVDPVIRCETITKLQRAYDTSTDEGIRHGIVHCVHMIVQDFPEIVPDVKDIFIDAADSSHPMLCTAGISALSIRVQQSEEHLSKVIGVLKRACQSHEGSVRMSAVEAIEKCVRHDRCLLESLIQELEPPWIPQDDKEWLIYLSLLDHVVEDPKVEITRFLRALLTETSKESIEVRNKRRELVDKLPLELLLRCYEKYKDDLILDHISRRFYQSPILLKNSSDEIWDLAVENKMYPINGSIKEKLKDRICLSTGFASRTGAKAKRAFNSFNQKLRMKNRRM